MPDRRSPPISGVSWILEPHRGLESFFVEIGEPAPGRRTLPADLPELDPERVVTLAGHYGAEVLTDWP